MPSIPEQLIATVFAQLPGGTITAVGRREIYRHANKNRVVAIPLGSSVIDMADQPGDALYSDQGRCILLRRFEIEWQCHGAAADESQTDFTDAEVLYLQTLLAVRETMHNAVLFSGEQWIDQQENNDGYDKWGTVIKFTSTIDIRVYEPRGTIVTLTATPQIVTTVVLNEDTDDAVVINQSEGS